MLRMAAVLLSLSVCWSNNAHACSCPVVNMDQEHSQSAKEIFVGKVTSILSHEDRSKDNEVQLSVSQVIKGNTPSTTTVWTGSASSTCAFPFQEGREYLLFIRESRTVGLCSGARLFDREQGAKLLEQIKAYAQ